MSAKLALAIVGACLALAGCVTTSSQPVPTAIDPSLPPTYGTVTLAVGQEASLPMEAGGGLRASALSTRCNGYVYGAPDYVVNAQTAGAASLVIVAASNTADITLMVLGPSGTLYCDDDGAGNLNPGLLIRNAPAGRYIIWVGTYENTGYFEPAGLAIGWASGGGISNSANANAAANANVPRPTTRLN